jgi:hypothetical protein
MKIFLGNLKVAGRYLPYLETFCNENGGSILITQGGISYELSALYPEPEELQEIQKIPFLIQEMEFLKAA